MSRDISARHFDRWAVEGFDRAGRPRTWTCYTRDQAMREAARQARDLHAVTWYNTAEGLSQDVTEDFRHGFEKEPIFEVTEYVETSRGVWKWVTRETDRSDIRAKMRFPK